MVTNNSKDLLDLEHTNNGVAASTSSSLESKLIVCKQNRLFNSEVSKPETKPDFSSLPKSQVLGKVKDFLGVISEANEKLQLDAKDNTERYDIEVLSGKESEYIEMDLMLGVADLQTPEAIVAAEAAIAGYQPEIHLAASSSESESEDSTDESDDDDESDDEANVEATTCAEGETSSTFTEGKRHKPAEENPSSDTLKRPSSKKRPKIIELS